LLAGAAGVGSNGYPIGFAVAAIAGVTGAVIAWRSLQSPPPTPALLAARQ
jgi:hypothetical protein